MARIKLGAIVADIRGKVSGNIFARNGSGAYVKTYTKPINPQSQSQTEQRALMSSLASSWRGLNDIQRNSWVEKAPSFPTQNAVGDKVIYSGEQLYIKLNLMLLGIGQAQLTVAPDPQEVTLPSGPTIEVNAGPPEALQFSYSAPGSYLQADATILTFASAVVSNGVTSIKSPRYRKVSFDSPVDLTVPTAITSKYQAIYGTITPGGKIFLKQYFVLNETGQSFLIFADSIDSTAV